MTTSAQHQTKRDRLILVDIENGSGRSPKSLAVDEIADLVERTITVLDPGPRDDVVVGCNPAWHFAIRAAWPGSYVRVRGGEDGADLELIAHASEQRIKQYREVWIVSGDGSLVRPAVFAYKHGIPVVVVARPASLARNLKWIAARVIPFHWAPRERSAA